MENILVTAKSLKSRIELDGGAAQRARRVFRQCRSCWDCLNFISALLRSNCRGTSVFAASAEKKKKGGRPASQRLSVNPRKEAVESQRRRVDTCQQLPNKTPLPPRHKRLCFIYNYMMEKVGQHPRTPLIHTSNIRPPCLISLGQQRNLHN